MWNSSQTRAKARGRRRRGLSLLETAMATMVVGLAVLSLIKLVATVTTQNVATQRVTIGLMLANNIREMMAGLPYNDPAIGTHLGANGEALATFNDVEDFDGLVASPPVDANRQPIPELANWKQQVTVKHVSPSNYTLTDSLATDSACTCDRVAVTVSYQPPGGAWITVVTTGWLKTK